MSSPGEWVRAECKRVGVDPESLDPIATNGKTGDQLISVYELAGNLVADTNGDPVWEQSTEWQDLDPELRAQAERNRDK